jgi:hypothetical protein
MTQHSRLLARALVAIVVVGSVSACVSPGARVPCDGRLEPINPPATKAQSSIKAPPSARKASP